MHISNIDGETISGKEWKIYITIAPKLHQMLASNTMDLCAIICMCVNRCICECVCVWEGGVRGESYSPNMENIEKRENLM